MSMTVHSTGLRMTPPAMPTTAVGQRHIPPVITLPTDTTRFSGSGKTQAWLIARLLLLPIAGIAAMFEATTGTVRDQLWAPTPETSLSSTFLTTESGRAYVKAARHYPMNEKRVLTPMASSLELELIPMDPQQNAAQVFSSKSLTRADRNALTQYMQTLFFDSVDKAAAHVLADPTVENGQKYTTLYEQSQGKLTPREQRNPQELAKTMGTVTLRGHEFTARIVSAGAGNCRLIENYPDSNP